MDMMEKLDRNGFTARFVLGPTLCASFLPTLVFGLLVGESGSNLLWGSYFGLGWCISAFWSGEIVHDAFSSRIGFAWGSAAMVPLFFVSRQLHAKLSERGRKTAFKLLFATMLVDVPFSVMMRLDRAGVHLPDYTFHLATSY